MDRRSSGWGTTLFALPKPYRHIGFTLARQSSTAGLPRQNCIALCAVH